MKGYEKIITRSVERGRRTFIEGISTVSIEEIPTEFDELAVERLNDSLERNNLFIVGEMHGVKENVNVIYTLFKKFGFRQLALEWEPELKDVAEKFLSGGELNFNAIKNSSDGRVTAGHFALMRKLKSEGMLAGLVCFDGGSDGEGWNARDAAMAKNILNSLSEVPTLVVAGNFHTKTEVFHLNDESIEQHPMGENIKKEIPDVAIGKIEYLTGQYHNFGTNDFVKLGNEKLPERARFYKGTKGLYTFEIPNAHAAIVPNPHER